MLPIGFSLVADGNSCASRYVNVNSTDLSNKGKSIATSFYSLPDNALGILQLPADGVFSYISSSGLGLLAKSLILLVWLLSCPEDLRVVIIYCLGFFLYFGLLVVLFCFFNLYICSKLSFECMEEDSSVFSSNMSLNMIMCPNLTFFTSSISSCQET